MTIAVLCFVFAAWPLVAFLGGSGFSPLTGIAALATSPWSLPKIHIRPYMVAFACFLGFAAASAVWSPGPVVLFEVRTLSVKSEVLRWGLLMVAGGMLIASAQRISPHDAGRVVGVATVALFVHFVLVGGLAVLERQALEFFYANRPTDDGVQNITRNAMNLAVTAPFLILALTERRSRAPAILIGIVILFAVIGICILRDLDAGLLALAASAGCYAVLRLFPRIGFRVLGGLISLVIMTAPAIFHVISAGANAATSSTSFQYRQLIWHRVLEFIWDKPIFGSGVGALRASRDVIPEGAFAGQLVIPNHPHNMLLQLWAETGSIGAGMVSLTVFLAAWRMPQPNSLGPSRARSAAIVGGLCASWVSFDLWNEAWWAVFCLLATLTVVYFRRPTLDSLPPKSVRVIRGL